VLILNDMVSSYLLIILLLFIWVQIIKKYDYIVRVSIKLFSNHVSIYTLGHFADNHLNFPYSILP